jgi:uncharacterized protein
MKRVAIVGSGLAGLAAKLALEDRFEVQLYDAESFGQDELVPLLFDPARHAATASLVRKLGLPTAPFVPSFAVTRPAAPALVVRRAGRIEGGWRPSRRAYGHALRAIDLAPSGERRRAEEWLPLAIPEHEVRESFLLPLASAATGLADRRWRDLPMSAFVAAWRSAGPGVAGASWQRVAGGARAVLAAWAATRQTETARVARLQRTPTGIDVLDARGGFERHDALVLAVPPAAAMQLLSDMSLEERRALAGFPSATRRVVLHDDPRWTPAEDASVGVVSRDGIDLRTIALNDATQGRFVSFDLPAGSIDPATIRQESAQNWVPSDTSGRAAQARLDAQQGHNRTWHVGPHLADGTPRGTIEIAAAVARRLA